MDTLIADKTNVRVGDTVKVTVAISADSGLGTCTFDLKYDKDAFKVKSTYVPSEDESDDAGPVDGEDGCDDYGDNSHCEEVVVPFGDLFE